MKRSGRAHRFSLLVETLQKTLANLAHSVHPDAGFARLLGAKLCRVFLAVRLPRPKAMFAAGLQKNLLKHFKAQAAQRSRPVRGLPLKTHRFFGRFSGAFSPKIRRFGALATAATFAIFLVADWPIAPAFSAGETVLRATSAEVFVYQNGGQQLRSAGVGDVHLGAGDAVMTSETGAAEIDFFEGSVLRLAPNSHIEITALQPTAQRGDLGRVSVRVVAGAAWARTHAADTRFSSLQLWSGETALSMGAFGAGSMEVSATGVRAACRTRSCAASSGAEEFLLPEGTQIGRAPGGRISVGPSADTADAAILQHFRQDAQHARAFLEQAVQEAAATESQESIFLDGFFEALLEPSTGNVAALRESLVQAKEWEIAVAQKIAGALLPPDPAFSLKSMLADEANAANSAAVWEARDLALNGDLPRASRVLQKQLQSGHSPQNIGEQLGALEALEALGLPAAQVEAAREAASRGARALLPADFPWELAGSHATRIAASVMAYSTETGRANTLRAQMIALPSVPSQLNLAVGITLREELPAEVRPLLGPEMLRALGLR